MKYLLAAVFVALSFLIANPKPQINNSTTSKAQQVSKVTREVQTDVPELPPQEPVVVEPSQPEITQTVAEPSSDKETLMAQAGIASSDWPAVDYIVSHESSWQGGVVNPSSGSCGLVQELPCGKSGCTLGDQVCQLRWATNYATVRYGGWWGAHSFWQSNRWW